MEKAKSVGIWIRVSTEDRAQGESPQHHETRALYYVESRGWQVKRVYHLEAVSGRSGLNHPETKKILEDMKTRNGDLHIIWNMLDAMGVGVMIRSKSHN